VLRDCCADQLDEQARDYIQQIYNGTLRMSRLITTLLKFSRVARVELRRQRVDLSVMAREVAAELQKTTPERKVIFRIAEGITGSGDAALLRVVFNNLMGNAWKYSATRDDAVIEFGVTERDGNDVCFVRDNGPGFDMAHAEQLFVPFQRLPGASAPGDGIGLATVDRIVRRHGGRIWGESDPGQGATFFFTLQPETAAGTTPV
jgi:signal transduction histidine kinase